MLEGVDLGQVKHEEGEEECVCGGEDDEQPQERLPPEKHRQPMVLVSTNIDVDRYKLELCIKGWEAKRLKGCVFSPPSLLPVPGGGKEARKSNLSIASNPVSVHKKGI